MNFIFLYYIACFAVLAQLCSAYIAVDATCHVKPDKVDAFKTAVAKQFRIVEKKDPQALSHWLEGFYKLPKGSPSDPVQ